MNAILPFIIEHWASISAIVAAIGLRLFPTEKNYDIFQKLLRLLDLIIPNLKKGGGRHVAKVILFFVLASVSVGCYAQLNTRTRLIKFATGVQHAADTAENAGNAGRIWYDFDTDHFRVNEGGLNTFLINAGGGVYSFANGLTNTAGTVRLGGTLNVPTTIDHNTQNLTFTASGEFFINTTFDGFSTFGLFKLENTDNGQAIRMGDNNNALYYAGDYSASFTDESLISKRYADTKLDGTMVANRIPFGADANTLQTEAALTYTEATNLVLLSNQAGTHTTSIFGGEIQLDFPGGSDDLTINNAGISITGVADYQINPADSISIMSGTEGISFAPDVAGSNFTRLSFKDGTNRIAYIDFSSTDNSLHIGRGGTNVIKINNNNEVIFVNLQTDCTGAESGSIWNDAGALKVCP